MADASIKACLEALSAYLSTNMTELKSVTEGFPAPNEILQYPSLTITHSADPVFTPLRPAYLVEALPDADDDNRALAKYVVGSYDLKLQLDFWCGNKEERYRIYQKFFDKFNAEISPTGLSLQLTQYYNLWARFDEVSQNMPDDEGASERSEWRVRVMLLAQTKVVREKTETIITEPIENNLTTPDTV